MTRNRSRLENIVVVAIVLVLAQTLFEDLAVLLGWSVRVREVVLLAGLFFDLFFTIEFIARCYDAYRYRRLWAYVRYERGWIDFMASIPLLILNSGPASIALLAGGASITGVGGLLNVLKVVKAVRIARVLRLLRVLKIFRRIKHTDSVMAQRHGATISTIAVSVFVFTLLALAVGEAFFTPPGFETFYEDRAVGSLDYIIGHDLADSDRTDELQRYAGADAAILQVTQNGRVRYTRFDQEYIDRFYRDVDVAVITAAEIDLRVDLRPLNREQAAANLRYFAVILALILVLVFVYSPHFALTISDPIHVMRRGMQESNYNLEVKVPAAYRDDEVFRLAHSYNSVFLPMKDRSYASEKAEISRIQLDDVQDLFDASDRT